MHDMRLVLCPREETHVATLQQDWARQEEAQRHIGQHTMIPAPTMVTSAVFCATPDVENSLEAPRIICLGGLGLVDDGSKFLRSVYGDL
jgi:hypothetical protein